MTTREVLQKARALITDPKCFLTGQLSNREGAYCAVGALLAVTDITRPSQYEPALTQLVSHMDVEKLPLVDPCHGTYAYRANTNWKKVVHFNNTMGHECVLNLFDEAIARSK